MQNSKRIIAAFAAMALAVSLGGCLHGHHAEQVVYKPMKLGAADGQIEMTIRGA